jgi:hypothetical protein
MTDRLTEPNCLKPNFRVSCEAGDAGSLRVAAENVSFTIAQRIRLEGDEQLWESVQLHCQKEDDGCLTVQVLLWDPKEEHTLQIALLRSRPNESSQEFASLECDLNPQKIV